MNHLSRRRFVATLAAALPMLGTPGRLLAESRSPKSTRDCWTCCTSSPT